VQSQWGSLLSVHKPRKEQVVYFAETRAAGYLKLAAKQIGKRSRYLKAEAGMLGLLLDSKAFLQGGQLGFASRTRNKIVNGLDARKNWSMANIAVAAWFIQTMLPSESTRNTASCTWSIVS
jgi:hypothetical protein